jgi:hypothetical protein
MSHSLISTASWPSQHTQWYRTNKLIQIDVHQSSPYAHTFLILTNSSLQSQRYGNIYIYIIYSTRACSYSYMCISLCRTYLTNKRYVRGVCDHTIPSVMVYIDYVGIVAYTRPIRGWWLGGPISYRKPRWRGRSGTWDFSPTLLT